VPFLPKLGKIAHTAFSTSAAASARNWRDPRLLPNCET
jgi:hypothetical protein